MDGTVVGVEGYAVRGGPRAGMHLDEADAFLDPTTREEDLPWVEDPAPAGTWNGGLGAVWGSDDRGRQIQLAVVRDAGRVEGLDVPVTAEAALEPPTVAGVLVGRNCMESPGTWW